MLGELLLLLHSVLYVYRSPTVVLFLLLLFAFAFAFAFAGSRVRFRWKLTRFSSVCSCSPDIQREDLRDYEPHHRPESNLRRRGDHNKQNREKSSTGSQPDSQPTSQPATWTAMQTATETVHTVKRTTTCCLVSHSGSIWEGRGGSQSKYTGRLGGAEYAPDKAGEAWDSQNHHSSNNIEFTTTIPTW